MPSFRLADLSQFGTPAIINPLDYEAALDGRKAIFDAQAAARGLDFDAGDLEAEPALVLLQEAAYKEILLRARGNEILRGAYLYFAAGAAVDHLAAFYDVVRIAGEDDDRLKGRTVLAIQGRSTAGTSARYRAIALGASTKVADAICYVAKPNPTVSIAVFSTDPGGAADAALLATVAAAVGAPDVRMANDTIAVRSAVTRSINVSARLWLLPDAAESVIADLAASLPATWDREGGLGRDLTRSWLTARMMVGGVQRVEILAPSADVAVLPYEAVALAAPVLTFAGRAS
jgi:phage-related baseplate assembly protein